MAQQNFKMDFRSPIAIIMGVLVLFFMFYLMTQMVKWVWRLSLLAMPILLIVIFFINRNILINYIKRIRAIYKANKTAGIGAIALSVIGSPLVTLFMFFQALAYRKVQQMQKQHEERDGEYIEYKELEVSDRKPLRDNRRERIEIREKKNNQYDDADFWE